MRRARTASISAFSSTIGPREVFTRIAPGFIRAMSAAPIRPRVRSDSTRWMLTASERDSSSSFDTIVAPADCALSGVMFWLQASRFMFSALQ